MKNVLFIITLICILGACGQEEQGSNNYTLVEHEGIIAKIEQTGTAGHGHKGWYSMLLIPDIADIDISTKTEEELIKLAQENEGAYYGVSPDMYDELELEIGMKVNVYWGGGEGESDPPVRDAEKIEIISNK